MMDQILAVVTWLMSNVVPLIDQLVVVLLALIGLCMLIPGEQPEKFLQGIVDFLAKFSRKPKA